MMTIDEVVQLVVSVLPSVIAVFTTLGLIIKTLHEFTALKKDVVNMKAMEDVRNDLRQVIQENYELKKTLNETMTKIDRIQR